MAHACGVEDTLGGFVDSNLVMSFRELVSLLSPILQRRSVILVFQLRYTSPQQEASMEIYESLIMRKRVHS